MKIENHYQIIMLMLMYYGLNNLALGPVIQCLTTFFIPVTLHPFKQILPTLMRWEGQADKKEMRCVYVGGKDSPGSCSIRQAKSWRLVLWLRSPAPGLERNFLLESVGNNSDSPSRLSFV